MDQQRVNKKSQSSDQQSLKRSETSSSLVVGRARDQEEVVADEMAGKALKDWVSAVPVQPVDVSRNFSDSSEAVRRSLTVGRAADSEELIADEMADRALSQLRRKESHSSADANDPLGGTQVDSGTERQISALRGKGSSLRERELQGFSDAYGVDLSATRVHDSPQADDLSRNLQADAFTVGNDVFFRQGLYRPGASAGDRLLGHELAHVAMNHGAVQRRVSSQRTLQRAVPDIPESLPENFAEMSAKDRIAAFQKADRERDLGGEEQVPEEQIQEEQVQEQQVQEVPAVLPAPAPESVPVQEQEPEPPVLEEPKASPEESNASPEVAKAPKENTVTLPGLASVADFTKATKGRWPAHWYENASDVLKLKLKEYHGESGHYKNVGLSMNRRYLLLHEIQEICDAYLAKRTIDLSKSKKSRETSGTLNQSGKDGKITAITALGKQAAKIKKVIEGSGDLTQSVAYLEEQGNKDAHVEKMKLKYKPQTAGTFFSGLGTLINTAAGDPGATKEFEIKTIFMVAPATYVGVVIVMKADQDWNNGKGGPLHAELELKGRLEVGADLGVFALEAGIDLGFFLESKAMNADQLGSWFSLGAYNNFRSLLPESVVNYLWFGSGGTNFNKAKSDQWMERIDEELHKYPDEREKKYKDNPEALEADRKRWGQQAQDTYVRAGLVGGLSGSAKVKDLAGKVAGSLNVQGKMKTGTEVNAKSLHEYVDNDVHDRSFSKSFASWEREAELVIPIAGYQGAKAVVKEGQNLYGEETRDFGEYEFKVPLPWPASSIFSLMAGLNKSWFKSKGFEETGTDMVKETGIAGVFSSPQLMNAYSQIDGVQEARAEAAAKAKEAANLREMRLQSPGEYEDFQTFAKDAGGYVGDKASEAAGSAASSAGDWASNLNENFVDEAGFGANTGGVVVKIKVEQTSATHGEVHVMLGAQTDIDRELGEGAKVAAKVKIAQMFFDKKWDVPW